MAGKKIFVSYAHADADYLTRLRTFLKPLEHEGSVEAWDDTHLRTGQKWEEEIKKHLAAADVAILLVSADFLASEFIANNELPPILAAEASRGLTVMPVVLGPCRFARTPSLSQFQSANPPSSPLSGMTDGQRDEVWNRLAEDIDALPPRAHP